MNQTSEKITNRKTFPVHTINTDNTLKTGRVNSCTLLVLFYKHVLLIFISLIFIFLLNFIKLNLFIKFSFYLFSIITYLCITLVYI